uniref:Major sperm protein n=1 Tax=Heterorhabditis bacteriophora TaxID=37862 RepID=A0A1I7WMW6_HETBA
MIRFIGDTHGEIRTYLKLSNRSDMKQAFKVKCTRNDMFRIRPAMGILDCNQTAVVSLVYKANGDVPEDDKHHFGVYHIPAPEGCSCEGAWSEHYGPPLGEFRLKFSPILKFVMFQERFGSSSTRNRVQSAPPIDAQKRRLSLRRACAKVSEELLEKPTTPDPENLYRILQARISSALSGPEVKIRQRGSEESSQESEKLFPGRTSRDRYENNKNIPPPVDQCQLCCILMDVKDGNGRRGMDKSDDEITSRSLYGRRRSLVRQSEQDESATLSGVILQPRSASAGIRGRTGISKMEARLSGYRHEKMRSSTRSGELPEDQVSGLVYDPDFDCYYNPQDDQYYRLELTTKSEMS